MVQAINLKGCKMTTLENVIENVPSEYVLDVPYKNRTDLFNAVYNKVWEAQALISELEEQQDIYENKDKSFADKISSILFELNFDFDEMFTGSWVYIRALEGCYESQEYVADFFERGSFGPKNYKAAVYWYTKVANSGSSWEASQSCLKLADFYDKGLGVAVDPVTANYWRSKSVALKAA
jgi:TPR repeat protein